MPLPVNFKNFPVSSDNNYFEVENHSKVINVNKDLAIDCLKEAALNFSYSGFELFKNYLKDGLVLNDKTSINHFKKSSVNAVELNILKKVKDTYNELMESQKKHGVKLNISVNAVARKAIDAFR